MTRLARSNLAAAGDGVNALAWPKLLEALLSPAKGYVNALVEVLKYPTSALRDLDASDSEPTTATDVPLDGLRSINPNAPGKEAGLTANLALLTTAYPAIDLDAPPACPQPLLGEQNVACLAGTGSRSNPCPRRRPMPSQAFADLPTLHPPVGGWVREPSCRSGRRHQQGRDPEGLRQLAQARGPAGAGRAPA